MPMRVELLFWERDPEYMVVRQRLVEVLSEDAFETPVQMIAVGSEADAALLDFHGSPTIRIEGVDAVGTADAPVGLRLRRPLPGKEEIRSAVERTRGWAHGRRD